MGRQKISIGRSVVVLFLFALFLGPNISQAVDLTHRFGIGYKNQFSVDMPAVAFQYYPSPAFGVSLALGVDTKEEDSKLGAMGKFFRIVYAEKNLNFYLGAGAGLLSIETAGVNQSGFELSSYLGAEFFFPGLESIGFSFEAGVGVVSISNGTRFRTFGDSPLRAGILFYF